MPYTAKDREILRELGKKVNEIANHPDNKKKIDIWKRHNGLKRGKPMVHVCLSRGERVWEEILPGEELRTSSDFCRNFEWWLRTRIYYWEHIKDDTVIEAFLTTPVVVRGMGWGIETKTVCPEEKLGAKHYVPVVETEADIEKIKMPEPEIDWEETEKLYSEAREIFDGVLPIKKNGNHCCGAHNIDTFAAWRGLGQIYLDLIERPEWFHRVMEKMTAGTIRILDYLEKQNVLVLNNNSGQTGSGGIGFSDELPQKDFDGVHVRLKDLWGSSAAQMFSEVSPDMHEEFSIRYEKRTLEKFGLSAYGCCEPLHKKIHILKQIKNLRRISMSPWVNVDEGAKQLEDKYIFSFKPAPFCLSYKNWDTDAVRKHLRDALEKTRGCIIEMVLNSVDTTRNQPQRIWEWARIAKELAEEYA